MKFLCEFKVKNTIDDFEIEKSVNDKGEEIQTKKPVKKDEYKNFGIRKPNRVLMEEAREFYSVEYSKAIKKGILPAAMLAKRFSDDDGSMSEIQKKEYADLYIKLTEKNKLLDELNLIKEIEKTEEQKDQTQIVYADIISLTTKIREIEENQLSLYNQTAETYAKNKLLIWWLLHLSYGKDGEPKCYFDGESYDDKIKKYDVLLEKEDDFVNKILKYFTSLVGFWSASSNEKELTQKEFDLIIKILDEQDFE